MAIFLMIRPGMNMLIYDLLKMALRSLAGNKLRTFLTTLGIVIGVAAVISMISIGEGAKKSTLNTISKFGTNIVSVRPGQQKSRHVSKGNVNTLTLADEESIRNNIDSITGVSAYVYRSAQLKYASKNSNTTVRGVNVDYAMISNYTLDQGRFFSKEEVTTSRKVCVLGASVVKNLFEGIDPIGKTMKVKGHNFLIIGITEAKGATSWFDPDDQIFIPITTAQNRIFGLKNVQSIDVQAKTIDDIPQIISDLERLLRRRHKILPGKEDDFYVRNSAERLSSWGDAAKTFSYLLGGIAAVSLLVGGIGIMNIMLVSVTERTREIGIRKAIGAKKKEIMKQFLIESVLISFLGGAIGILLGVGISISFSKMVGWETLISLQTILLAFGFSVSIGIFFGYYPANKASNLNPIEALRYE
jgi:putative ABC transport system permease protein